MRRKTLMLSVCIVALGALVGAGCDINENQQQTQSLVVPPADPMVPEPGDRFVLTFSGNTTPTIAGGTLVVGYDTSAAIPVLLTAIEPTFVVDLYPNVAAPVQLLSEYVTAEQIAALMDPSVTLLFDVNLDTDGDILGAVEAHVAIWREIPGDPDDGAFVEHYLTTDITVTIGG